MASRSERDWTDLPDQQLKGLASIVKGKAGEELIKVQRRYNCDSAVSQHVLRVEPPNVVLSLLMDHMVDELVMRVRADVEMMITPSMAETAREGDKVRAEAARCEAEVAKIKAATTADEYRIKLCDTEQKKLTSEAWLAEQVEARYLKKQQELDRKIAGCDKAIAAANTNSLERLKAEVGVVRVVSTWLRQFTTLTLEDAERRTSLLELSDNPIAPRTVPPTLLVRPPVDEAVPTTRTDLLEMD